MNLGKADQITVFTPWKKSGLPVLEDIVVGLDAPYIMCAFIPSTNQTACALRIAG